MDEKFNDLIQVLKTLPSREGAMVVAEYRAARPGPLDDRWYPGMGGYSTASGVEVNERTALKYSPLFCGVRKISETIGSLPLHVLRETSMGKKKAIDHPLYRLLHTQPNPEMTSMQLREALISHALLWGNGYANIQQNLMGQTIALWPLDPSRMKVKRPNPNGLLVYEYTMTDSGETVNFPPWEILHLPGFGFNGLMGYGIVSLAREGIATGLCYEEYSARFFSNNATPAGFLEVPGIINDEEKKAIRKDWYRDFGGVSKSQLIGIIGQGMKFNPLSVHAKDAEFLESRKFQVVEMCRWLNVPPHWIYDLERSTNNNIEQQSLEVVIYTLRPWCVRIEQAIQTKLIHEDGISVEHRLEGLLRGDMAARTAFYIAGIQNGWLCPNDIRELENQELIENGDTYLRPLNMIPLGQDTLTPTNGKDKQTEKLLLDQLKTKKGALNVSTP